jgi:hypothetical protein
MEYKGFILDEFEDVEEDSIKISHDIVRPDGSRTFVHFTPYANMTENDLRLWVELGEPGRIEYGCGSANLDSFSLFKMAEESGIL